MRYHMNIVAQIYTHKYRYSTFFFVLVSFDTFFSSKTNKQTNYTHTHTSACAYRSFKSFRFISKAL